MHKCPACGKEAIEQSAKIYASSLFPAKCSSCGQLVAIRSFMVGSLVATIETLLILPFVITGSLQPPASGFVIWAVFAGGSLVFGSFGNLQKVSSNEVLATRIPMAILATFVVLGTLVNI